LPTLSDQDASRFEPNELERMLGRALARSASMTARRRRRGSVFGGVAAALAAAMILTTVVLGAPGAPPSGSAQSRSGSTGSTWKLVSDVSNGWQVLPGPGVGAGLPTAQLTCPSASTCYALGVVSDAVPSSSVPGSPPDDAIATTTDGGETWTPVTLPAAVSGSRLSCLTATTCALLGTGAGGSSVFLHTTDGGRTWSSGSGPAAVTSNDFVGGLTCTTATRCTAIVMPHLVAVGSGDIMSLTTSDGGQSWSEAPLPAGFNGIPDGLTCTSEGDCIVVGSDKGFPGGDAGAAYSRDGGATWTSSTVPPGTSGLHAVSCSGSFCIASSLRSSSSTERSILTSSDGGATWSEVTTTGLASHVMPFTTSFSCATNTDCWTGGTVPQPGGGSAVQISDAQGLLAQSLDGGHTWQDAELPSTARAVMSLSCPTATDCFALAVVGNANHLGFGLLVEHG
jgi:photosystem II stability/assembly factor-like uncharacterized protein